MSHDDIHRATLAFLDQFIARGAAPDIRELRSRLADAPEVRRRLHECLGEGDLSQREAYDAVIAFFTCELERRPFSGYDGEPSLWMLVDWMGWGPSDTTNDPAQWHDWLASVKNTAAG